MMFNDLRAEKFARWALIGFRIVLGIFWLLQLTWKPPPTFGCPNDGFCLWLDKEIQHPVIPLYADRVRTLIRPNAILFGWFTTVVEVTDSSGRNR